MDSLARALESSLPLFSAVGTLAGLMVGSFLNVVICRLPKMMENDWKDQCAELEGKTPLFCIALVRLVPLLTSIWIFLVASA